MLLFAPLPGQQQTPDSAFTESKNTDEQDNFLDDVIARVDDAGLMDNAFELFAHEAPVKRRPVHQES